MNTRTLRVIIPLIVLVIVGVGFAIHTGIGTLSALGWESISFLCPVGALGTMLASKMLVPRAVISLVIAIVAILLLGRAFCGWVCPVPVVAKLGDIFKKTSPDASEKTKEEALADAISDNEATQKDAEEVLEALDELQPKPCSAAEGGCSACAKTRGTLDSRHVILGGSLLTAAVFGFPVFCLICPIGLSIATVLLVMLLFGQGDVTWSIVVVPLLLIAEVVLFRKWCSKICPLAAFMSLVGKGNKTLLPDVSEKKCIEHDGIKCGLCAKVCPEEIDPRHPENGASWSECTRCRECIENCPGSAITMPFLPKKK